MCVVSFTGDYWKERIVPKKYPNWTQGIPDVITREEFNELKKDLEELKKLLKASKRFDEKLGEPDCEIDDKVKLIKSMAKAVNVDLEDIFSNET